MIVIAVTGGIGAGKSLASEYFRSRGALVLNTDVLAHEQLEPETPAFDRIVEEFGPSVLDAAGRIDRAALARAAFGSADSAAALNAIVHPAVAREVELLLGVLRDQPDGPRIVVIEVPLLVEAPAFAKLSDVVLAVAADPELRLRRSVSAGRDAQDAADRLERQATDAERAQIADRVIVNEGTREEFASKLELFWNEMVATRGSE